MGGNSIALIQRLQEMSISYSTGFTLPDYSDLLQCLAQEPHTSDLAPQLRQRLLSWLHVLAPYARMSLSSLANAMTCNYKYWIIDASSPYWPRQLNHISTRTDSEAPLCLWGLGSIDALCSLRCTDKYCRFTFCGCLWSLCSPSMRENTQRCMGIWLCLVVLLELMLQLIGGFSSKRYFR